MSTWDVQFKSTINGRVSCEGQVPATFRFACDPLDSSWCGNLTSPFVPVILCSVPVPMMLKLTPVPAICWVQTQCPGYCARPQCPRRLGSPTVPCCSELRPQWLRYSDLAPSSRKNCAWLQSLQHSMLIPSAHNTFGLGPSARDTLDSSLVPASSSTVASPSAHDTLARTQWPWYITLAPAVSASLTLLSHPSSCTTMNSSTVPAHSDDLDNVSSPDKNGLLRHTFWCSPNYGILTTQCWHSLQPKASCLTWKPQRAHMLRGE